MYVTQNGSMARQLTYEFHNMRGISWLSEELLASHRWICSIWWVSWLVTVRVMQPATVRVSLPMALAGGKFWSCSILACRDILPLGIGYGSTAWGSVARCSLKCTHICLYQWRTVSVSAVWVTSQHLQDNGVEAVRLENGWNCFMFTTVDWAQVYVKLVPVAVNRYNYSCCCCCCWYPLEVQFLLNYVQYPVRTAQ